jgi:hypothetical protein
VLEAGELIEAGTSGSQQDRVARPSRGVSSTQSAGEIATIVQGDGAGQGRLQVAADPGRGCANQQDRPGARPQQGSQRRVIAALVFATEDDPEAAGEGLERLDRRIDIGGLRVVEVVHTADATDEFKPVFDPGEGLHREPRDVEWHAGQRGGAAGSEDVLHVMHPAQRNLCGGHPRLAVGDQYAVVEPETLFQRTGTLKPVCARRGLFGEARRDGVRMIEHGVVIGLLKGEHALFRGRILLKRAVPVEVVGSDIERDADVDAHRRQHLRLKAGKLEHGPGVFARIFGERGQGHADVAAHPHRQSGGPQQSGRRALSWWFFRSSR